MIRKQGNLKMNQGKAIKELISIRAKCYIYITKDGNSFRLKGISRAAQKEIDNNNFKNSLFNNEKLYVDNYRLQSENHEMHLIKQNKKALDPYDDKRILLDNIITMPYDYPIYKLLGFLVNRGEHIDEKLVDKLQDIVNNQLESDGVTIQTKLLHT